MVSQITALSGVPMATRPNIYTLLVCGAIDPDHWWIFSDFIAVSRTWSENKTRKPRWYLFSFCRTKLSALYKLCKLFREPNISSWVPNSGKGIARCRLWDTPEELVVVQNEQSYGFALLLSMRNAGRLCHHYDNMRQIKQSPDDALIL